MGKVGSAIVPEGIAGGKTLVCCEQLDTHGHAKDHQNPDGAAKDRISSFNFHIDLFSLSAINYCWFITNLPLLSNLKMDTFIFTLAGKTSSIGFVIFTFASKTPPLASSESLAEA